MRTMRLVAAMSLAVLMISIGSAGEKQKEADVLIEPKAPCTYANLSYSDGAWMCQIDKQMVCSDGHWMQRGECPKTCEGGG